MPKKKIKHIATVFRGKLIPSSNKSIKSKIDEKLVETPILSFDNVIENKNNLELRNTVNDEFNKYQKFFVDLYGKYKDNIVQSEDIIVSANRPKDNIKFINFTNNYADCIYSHTLFIIRVRKDVVRAKFLFFVLKNVLETKFFGKKMSVELLENIEFHIPSLSEQDEFLKDIENLNELKIKIDSNILKYIENK